jgi:hypothetical protein
MKANAHGFNSPIDSDEKPEKTTRQTTSGQHKDKKNPRTNPGIKIETRERQIQTSP